MIEGCPCGVDFLPVCFVTILFVSLAISFTIAVIDSDVFPWFPAISDTATKSPESNIFGQMVNIACFIGFILVYVRYLQVKRDVERLDGNRATMVLNRWSLYLGFIAVLGSSFVANFPEKQVVVVHLIGAAVLFLFGNIYAWTQTVISFHMRQFGLVGTCIYKIRCILSLVSTLSFIVSMVMMFYASKKWSGNNLQWKSDDPGYKEHVVGDAFEWLMVFSFLFMFLTFTKEFCQSKLEIKLVGGEDRYEPIQAQPREIEI